MLTKIATWNMGHWMYKEKAQAAWAYIDEIIRPDISLVQEAAPLSDEGRFVGSNNKSPVSLSCDNTYLWRAIGGKRKWGSGIFTRGLPLREVPFNNCYPGCVVAAEVMLPDDSSLTVVSLHGLIDAEGYSITVLHRMLSDLTLLLDGKMGKRQIIIGGDFNADVQFDKRQPGESHRIFFERLKNFGLFDCLARFHESPVQTLRHAKSQVPWQNDYIFASEGLSEHLVSCDVNDSEEVHELSDHNPVVAVFNF